MKYKEVRQWLISKERYEDVIKFEKSDTEKERFLNEMEGRELNDRSCPDPVNETLVPQEYFNAMKLCYEAMKVNYEATKQGNDARDVIINALRVSNKRQDETIKQHENTIIKLRSEIAKIKKRG